MGKINLEFPNSCFFCKLLVEKEPVWLQLHLRTTNVFMKKNLPVSRYAANFAGVLWSCQMRNSSMPFHDNFVETAKVTLKIERIINA